MKLFFLNGLSLGMGEHIFAIVAKDSDQAIELAKGKWEDVEAALADGEALLEQLVEIDLAQPSIQGYFYGR